MNEYQLKTSFRLKIPTAPIKTYFYQRPDGTIFPCEAKEAWAAHKKFKQVGVSDGKTYFIKLMEIANKYNGKIDISTDEGQEKMRQVQGEMQEALNAEIEVARGKPERPPQNDVNFINGDASRLKGFLK